ncbi:CaiB/BaiF CoA-transferase family protein [Acidovorax sp.]|uniref:CaiB/BaiF CoA transferase family protein n=1 Tax=Acidovorax sp. TaxID=1872122 RepID=UPI0027BA9DDE|nr:CaiB/BaiF CoA-transferase family protein [Acidovorax sp.]
MENHSSSPRRGPLAGLRIVEFAGLGPGPFACMLLSDMGAEVVRIDRPNAPPMSPLDIVGRGRQTVLLDLKRSEAIEQVLQLLEKADALVEGFRPGVMERLGLGPQIVAQHNPRLVYGRMTGWGQYGPLAQAAGHDINYIAVAGALATIGETGRGPVPPLNLVGDYGGGSLYLVSGLLAALLHARTTGEGQVVDAAICDGVLSLLSNNLSHRLRGLYRGERSGNMLDGGAPYYTTYETADNRHVAVGPIEPQFFSLLCQQLDLPDDLRDAQNDRARWHLLRDAIATAFRQRTLAEWRLRIEGSDSCFAPVLTLEEAQQHPHLQSRKSFENVDGVTHIAPAPRFSRTPGHIQSPAGVLPVDVSVVMARWQKNSSNQQ